MPLDGRGLTEGSSSKNEDFDLSVGGAFEIDREGLVPTALGNGGGVLILVDPVVYILLLLGGAELLAAIWALSPDWVCCV